MPAKGQHMSAEHRAKIKAALTQKIKRNCVNCGNTFFAKNSEIANGKGKFCSKQCGYSFRTKGRYVKCERCGKEFFARPDQIRLGNGKYCSKSCAGGLPLIEKPCEWCGNIFMASQSKSNRGKERYCSKRCKGLATSGPHSHLWRGGVSFGSYCHRFNRRFKEHIRTAFQRKCFLCGVTEDNKKHDVHHIDYNKNSICNGHHWAFVPLCHAHHMSTNSNRWYWFNLLICYWAMNPEINFRGSDNWHIHHQLG